MSRFCLPKWKVGGKEQTSCTKDKLRTSDMTKPCSLLSKELEFIKQLDKSRGKTSSQSKYNLMNLDEMANNNDSPVEVTIKVLKANLMKQSKSKMDFRLKGKRRRASFFTVEELPMLT